MREHQIAISLKPQQFELLQKLARERGFKSVTAYVKQKIVELALGVDSDLPAPGQGDLQYGGGTGGLSAEQHALLGDLSRIHSELRAFAGQSFQDEFAAGVSAAEASATAAFDQPPPGQNASSPVGPIELGGTAAVQSGPAKAAGQPSSADGEAVSSQVLPSNNLGGFGFRLGGFAGGGAASRFQQPLDNADRLSGYREIMDDLEELADRAFAISPRLGALDEAAPDESAGGRGSRQRAESILVEPILPASANAPQAVKAEPPKPAQSAPINMVKAFAAADLPAPGEVAQASAPAKVQAAAPAEAQAFAPAKVQAPREVQVVPPVTGQAAPPQELQTAPPQELQTAPPQEVQTAPPQEVQTTEDVQSMAPVEEPAALPMAASAPLPGDDLLSELLDESLVAHAGAPRPADNPFAVGVGFEKLGTEGSAAIVDVTPGSAPYADPDDLDQSGPYEPPVEQEPSPELTSDPMPDPQENDTPADPGSRRASAAYNDLADPGQRQSQSGSHSADFGELSDKPQDPGPPGHSNLSGGPPPKRRRT